MRTAIGVAGSTGGAPVHTTTTTTITGKSSVRISHQRVMAEVTTTSKECTTTIVVVFVEGVDSGALFVV